MTWQEKTEDKLRDQKNKFISNVIYSVIQGN